MMSILNSQFGRMGFYFSIGYFICASSGLMNHRQFNSKIRPIARLMIVLLCIAYFVIGAKGDVMGIDEYKFLWEETGN